MKQPLATRKLPLSLAIRPTGWALTGAVAAMLLGPWTAIPVKAATPKALHSFGAVTVDAQRPSGVIEDSSGNFYGVSANGGANQSGAIIKTTSSGTLTILHSFAALDYTAGTNSDGSAPLGRLIGDTAGNYYGVTSKGGSNGGGTIFKITSGGTFTTLHTFSEVGDDDGTNSDGSGPAGPLARASDGDLYGMAEYGGTHARGTIFKITTGGTFTTLHSFAAFSTSGAAENSDGAQPEGGLLLGQDGNFYGLAPYGGTSGTGTFFKITTSGTFTTLHSFGSLGTTDSNGFGANPMDDRLVQDASGNFYGTAYAGGTHDTGTIFKITTSGSVTLLHTFAAATLNGGLVNSDGAHPTAGLVLAKDGNLYGQTKVGGAHGSGAIYKITTGGTFTLLHSFAAVAQSEDQMVNSDGSSPGQALIQGADDNLYGSAANGGKYGYGTFYKVTTGGTLTNIYHFGLVSNSDGKFPRGGLVESSDDDFYGTAQQGGAHGFGTIFKQSSGGTFTTLHSFAELDGNRNSSEGAFPNGGLIFGQDGNLWGLTSAGGLNGTGCFYKITTGGTFTKMHSFGALDSDGDGHNADGAAPYGTLVQTSNGDFYGTASAGGAHGTGAIYKLTTSGAVTTLHSFSALGTNNTNSDGACPLAGLTLASDGNLYGMTQGGGASGTGTIFKITTGGTLTSMYSFSPLDSDGGNSGGCFPSDELAIGSDLLLYGTAPSGGACGTGTIFSMSIGGTFTSLYDFSMLADNQTNTDGACPLTGLACDGINFFAVAQAGGDFGAGVVFQMTQAGELMDASYFPSTIDPSQEEQVRSELGDREFRISVTPANSNASGAYPNAPLCVGNDGNLYGLTDFGGSNGEGVLFESIR